MLAQTTVAVVLLVVVLAVSLLARAWMMAPAKELAPEYKRKVREVVRQAMHWSQVAGQDTDPLMALKHYEAALAHLAVAYQLTTEQDISALAQCSAHDWYDQLRRRQAAAQRQLSKACPELGKQAKQ